MDNFCKFWDRLNGEPYKDGVPPPTEYKLQSMDFNTGDDHATLKPLSDEDTARYSDEDVRADMERKKALGWNPTKLGKPMSDEEFHKFHGLEKR